MSKKKDNEIFSAKRRRTWAYVCNKGQPYEFIPDTIKAHHENSPVIYLLLTLVVNGWHHLETPSLCVITANSNITLVTNTWSHPVQRNGAGVRGSGRIYLITEEIY